MSDDTPRCDPHDIGPRYCDRCGGTRRGYDIAAGSGEIHCDCGAGSDSDSLNEPKLADLRGRLPDITGGLTSEGFVRQQRDTPRCGGSFGVLPRRPLPSCHGTGTIHTTTTGGKGFLRQPCPGCPDCICETCGGKGELCGCGRKLPCASPFHLLHNSVMPCSDCKGTGRIQDGGEK